MVSLLSHTSFEKVFTTLYIIESPKLLDLSDSLDSNRITHAPNLLLLPSCLLMHPIKCKGSLSPKRLPEPAVSARRALLRKILDFKGLISFLEKAPFLCFCFFMKSCWTIPYHTGILEYFKIKE